jgi:hypothetical protein
MELFRTVHRARTERGHDYNRIAEMLSNQGVKSSTNRPLTGALLYALYVKRLKTLAIRRGSEPEVVNCAFERTHLCDDSHFNSGKANIGRNKNQIT